MSLRQATRADLDALRDIALAAFPQDPQWDYRFPKRDRYPQDTSYWTRRQYEAYFDSETSVFETLVISVETEGDKCHVAGDLPIAMAVWEVTYVPKEGQGESDEGENSKHYKAPAPPLKLPQDGRCCRRDANVTHMEAFVNALVPGKSRYFDDVYGMKQVHLQILATHPDFQRRGFGSRLCRWGLDIAQKHSCCVSVFGSPMGKDLYTHLGFKQIGALIVQVKGEESKLIIAAMVWLPSVSDDYVLVSPAEPTSADEK